jgi:hypothetical protein
MGYKPPFGEGELYSVNLRSIRKWIENNKSRIKAKPNQTVLYSGRIYDLDVLPDLPKEDRDSFKGTPVWMSIEKHRKLHKDRDISFDYQTLEQVLKSIRDHPVLVDKDHHEQEFSNAHEFFASIKSHAKLLPNAKGVYQESWDRLSEVFAGNAEGDIHILDGLADDFRKLDKQKILLRKELDALLKNTKLSTAGKAVLLKKMTKYGELFDHQYTKLIKQLDEATAGLTRPMKR